MTLDVYHGRKTTTQQQQLTVLLHTIWYPEIVMFPNLPLINNNHYSKCCSEVSNM